MTLTDDECYRLFLELDTYARMQRGDNKTTMEWRERFLPFYRDWHAKHPGEIHPSARRT